MSVEEVFSEIELGSDAEIIRTALSDIRDTGALRQYDIDILALRTSPDEFEGAKGVRIDRTAAMENEQTPYVVATKGGEEYGVRMRQDGNFETSNNWTTGFSGDIYIFGTTSRVSDGEQVYLRGDDATPDDIKGAFKMMADHAIAQANRRDTYDRRQQIDWAIRSENEGTELDNFFPRAAVIPEGLNVDFYALEVPT